MFYSHTFLARKGPLGTVWCAAHLQHRLRKSQYMSTNIPSTVERIMCPEVPIALRMSAHLLLGVVRIYSKQIDYFHEDCNVILITLNRVFTAVSVNLPDDANQAPFHSITLPQRFELDSVEIDDYFKDGYENLHTKSQEDITLTEQIPTGKDPYIVITFDEHDLKDSSFIEDNDTWTRPMDENVSSPVRVNSPRSPSNQSGADDRGFGHHISPQNFSSVRHGFRLNGSPILPDRAEPDKELEEQINKDNGTHIAKSTEKQLPPRDDFGLNGSHIVHDQTQPDKFSKEQIINKDNETSGPVNDREEELSDKRSPSAQKDQEPHSSKHINSKMSFDRLTTELVIRPSPSVAELRVRRGKRKHFDETTVLSNEHMKKALNDTSGLCRVKRNCPSSSFDIWRLSKRLKKDTSFFEPLITGACVEFQNMYKEDLISAYPHLVKVQEGTSTGELRLTTRHGDNIVTEIVRNNGRDSPDIHLLDLSLVRPDQNGKSYSTPENSNHGLQSDCHETTDLPGSGTIPTKEIGESSKNIDSEIETPDFYTNDDFNFEYTRLSDIPEMVTSPGDLGFLEQDDNSPVGSEGTPGFGFGSMNKGTPALQALTSRTRAVAEYFKRQSPGTPPISSGGTVGNPPGGDLSLNKILEGKSRKICARMFYETLVLKNYDLIDVQQEKRYGDVTLKVTPKLSKGIFSG